jgi:hypothetical protein
MSSIQFIINPRTNRVIQVGNQTWKKLSEEEKRQGEELMRMPLEERKNQLKEEEEKEKEKEKEKEEEKEKEKEKEEKKEEESMCSICTENVILSGNTAKCCQQTLCKKCYISMTTYKCPYCRKENPLNLTDEEKKEKDTKTSQSRRRDVDARVRADIDLARELNREPGQEEPGQEPRIWAAPARIEPGNRDDPWAAAVRIQIENEVNALMRQRELEVQDPNVDHELRQSMNNSLRLFFTRQISHQYNMFNSVFAHRR